MHWNSDETQSSNHTCWRTHTRTRTHTHTHYGRRADWTKPSRTSRTSSRSFKVREDMRICLYSPHMHAIMSSQTSYTCAYVVPHLICMCMASRLANTWFFASPFRPNHLLNCWRFLISDAFVGQRGEYAKKVDLYEQKQKQVCLSCVGAFFVVCVCVFSTVFALICSAINSFFLSNGGSYMH